MGLTNTTGEACARPTITLLAKNVMVVAVWLGVVTGLVEGSLFLLFQKLDWLSWVMSQWLVSFEIVWISSAFCLLLFVVVGLVVLLLAHWLPQRGVLRWSLFLFVWMACFDWLAISGRIHAYGALILAAGLASVAMRWFSRHEASTLRFARRSLRWILATALLAFIGIEGGLWLKERLETARLSALPPGSPNILVIVVDTLRADHVSAYGYTRATSPNLDRIARQGVLFENAYAASSWTLPSHVSMLTGHYPHEHRAGRPREFFYYDGRYPSIAQVLAAGGYRTGAFSANNIFFCRGRGLGLGFLHFEDYFGSWADMASRTLYGRKFNQYIIFPRGYDIPGRKRAQEVNQEFFRWVDRAPSSSFFAFLNYMDVHDPYMPPQPYRILFGNSKNADSRLPGGLINQFKTDTTPRLTPEQVQGEMDAYDGAIAYADEQIGNLFSSLRERGLAENTLVVITSDHGEEFGDHGLLTHGKSLYRQETRVPLIFWWPGNIPAGVRLKTPVTNAALPVTITHMLGQSGHMVFPGTALEQLWNTPTTASDWPEPLVELADMGRGMNSQSLITPHWQYIQQDSSGEELYDWEEDPEELHNLAATPEGQGIDREFRERLRRLGGERVENDRGNMQNQVDRSNLSGARRPTSAVQPR